MNFEYHLRTVQNECAHTERHLQHLNVRFKKDLGLWLPEWRCYSNPCTAATMSSSNTKIRNAKKSEMCKNVILLK